MKARVVGTVVAGAALLSGVAYWLSSRESTPEQDVASAAGVPSQASVEPSTVPHGGCDLAVGDKYRFTYRNRVRAEVNAQLPGQHEPRATPVETALAGVLSFEVLRAGKDEGAVLLGRLDGLDDRARKLGGKTLDAPFLAKVSPQCDVVAFGRHKGTSAAAARTQHVVLTDLGFSVVSGIEQAFPTSVGTLRATVSRGEEGEGHWVRKAVRYESVWSPRMKGVDVVEGVVNVRRGASAWFDSLTGEESVAGGPVERSTTTWELRAAPADAASLANASRMLEDYVWENALQEGVSEERISLLSEEQDHSQRVKAMAAVSYDVALKRFDTLLEHGANINVQWRDMAAFLDAHPDKVDDFAARITAEDFPAGFKAPAFLALGQARTPEARQALLGIFRDREGGTADRIRSSLALAARADVGLPLARELRAEASRSATSPAEAAVSRQAILHLGMMSGARPSEPDLREEAVGLATELLSKAQTPQDYSVVFGMLGNLAEGDLLPTIERFTRNPDPEIRRQVPDALRRYKVDRVRALVVDWLARETDEDVKRRLFDVVHHMHIDAARPVDPAIMRAALTHLKEQPKVLTRQSLFHILSPFVASNVEVKQALKESLKYELAEKSGLYSLVAQYLPPSAVYEVLSQLDGLRGQFGGGLPPVEDRPEPPRERPIPDPPHPSFTADLGDF